MPIQVGNRLPEFTFTVLTPEGPGPKASRDVFDGRKVLLFAVSGAFTPTCTNQHLPGFLAQHDAIKAKGIDTIACVSVNDAYVVDAWSKANAVGDRILMLADGNGGFARALGLDIDASRFHMGVRSRRYSMLVDDGIVKALNLDAPGQLEVSTADVALCQL